MLDKKSIEMCEKEIENIIKANKIEVALSITIMEMRKKLSIMKHTNPIDNVDKLMEITNAYEQLLYIFNRLWNL